MGLIVGVGLSAACGFRVFVPLLGMSIAHLTGHLTLSPGFDWIGSWPALMAFGTATILEIITFYVPCLDNLMDTAAIPAATIAGTIVTASQIGDMSPLMKWTLAAIAGGGVSLMIQGGTTAVRALSTGTTGGFGNFIVSTSELVAAVVVTILAIVVPLLCVVLVIWICYKVVSKVEELPFRKKLPTAQVCVLAAFESAEKSEPLKKG
jgi:hypothetical protein